MKTITLFGLIYSQHVSNFAYKIKKYTDYTFIGINKTPIFVSGEEYYKQSKETFDKIYNLQRSRIKIIDNIRRSLFAVYSIIKCAHKSDIVQFHYISPFVLPLAIVVKLTSKAQISSFIYGSDFLRANKVGLWCMSKVFSLSDSIVCDSSSVLEGLKKQFPKYQSIMCRCYFGSPIIDRLLKVDETLVTHNSMGGGKKVIMCGYNGGKDQQHIKIIESLKNVAKDFFWIFPMTYGVTNEGNKQEVITLLNSLDVDYIILDRFLSEEEWTNYIISTDIFIHMQVSDAFSSSITEHLLLGHILINGSWLIYKDLEDNDVYYISSDFDNLEQNLINAIKNYPGIQAKLKANKEKIVKMKSLDYCIKNYWIPYFKEL